VLASEGLERFYALGGSAAGAVGPVPRPAARDWLPECEAAARAADGTIGLALDVQGIRCAACVWLLQELWRRQRGARRIHVDSCLGRVHLVYDGDAGTAAAFLDAAARCGYPMAPASKEPPRDQGLLIRLGLCSAFAMNAMILGVAGYFGLGEGPLHVLFGQVAFGLATGSVIVGGPVFFRAALAGFRARMVHMDLPISLGLLLAYSGSVHGLCTGGPVYFDTVAIFTAFMLGGRFLQQRTLRRNRDHVLADDGAEHLRVRRLRDGVVELVPVAKIVGGDELVLAPGDLLPVRAELTSTAASFSYDWINGEAMPQAVAAGATVPAGAFLAGRSAVRLRASAGYPASGLAELLQRPVQDRSDERIGSRFWHLANRNYSVGVLVAASVAGCAWATVDAAQAMHVAVAVLVITCPCALGIATPLAFHLALAALRARGVFVRSGSLLERLRQVRHVMFDKTGTLTFGGMRAHAIEPPPRSALAVLSTIASSSNHPVSQAVLAALEQAPFLTDLEVAEIPGRGLEATLDGVRWRLGSASFATDAAGVAAEAATCVLSADGEPIARFRLVEDFRPGTAAEIAWLRQQGHTVHVLSGDRPERVAAAAAALSLPLANVHGGMSPDDKAAYVARTDRGDTLMVGDGINDSKAFAAAWCAGTPAMDRPVLPGRADFCFRGARSGSVRSVLEVAARYRHIVRTNLSIALVYNVAALAVCCAGLMTPGLCAVLMPVSSAALVLHTSVRGGRLHRRCA
jgi:Cu2+-exporting ATPase